MADESTPNSETWRIGELAAASGLSVRTLHHYDEVGLLRPSQRSSAGHRRYVADDVRRLHRILTLRDFGWLTPQPKRQQHSCPELPSIPASTPRAHQGSRTVQRIRRRLNRGRKNPGQRLADLGSHGAA